MYKTERLSHRKYERLSCDFFDGNIDEISNKLQILKDKYPLSTETRLYFDRGYDGDTDFEVTFTWPYSDEEHEQYLLVLKQTEKENRKKASQLKKSCEKFEREEYERLKKKFGGKNDET